MKLKNYALFDVIGISKAIERGDGARLLETFWKAADAWVTSTTFEPVSLRGGQGRVSPEVFVATFSDSALLQTEEDLLVADFWRIARAFATHMGRMGAPGYLIVSRAQSIEESPFPALGGRAMSISMKPTYINIGGSAQAWTNLWAADEAIKKHKAWHGKFSVYCAGDDTLAPGMQPLDCIEAPCSLRKQLLVHAIE